MKLDSSHTVMIVEDSPADYEVTLRAFQKSGLKNDVRHCETGDEAMDYLFRRGEYSDPENSPKPSIILLDLNMPGTDGRDVLQYIKKDEMLKKIPVIILTTSSDRRDVEECYKIGANSYIQKPVDLKKFVEAIERLHDYWFQIVIMPKS